jgi:hypothetical protein
MAAAGGFVSTGFDVFAQKPVQEAVLETTEAEYKPIASVDMSDLEFLIPADNDTYLDLDIKLFVRGKLIKGDGTDLDATDYTAGTNNFLHSLFSQCNITLNGISVTPASELYNYRSYIETLLTYGSDAAQTHLTMAYWYKDDGDVLPCDDTTNVNKGFIARWNRQKKSQEIQMIGRIHSDICNVPIYLIPGVRLQIKFTKARPSFFLMNKDDKSTTTFKFLDAKLFVRRVRANPAILSAHNTALSQGVLARYNITRVELKTFTFSSGSQSLSIDNAVIGPLPKRLLFTMVKNTDFLGSVNTNPYNFRHYDINYFALYVNGKQIPSGGLTFDMNHEKMTVMGYRTLFVGSGIHHSNQGLQITNEDYTRGYFMLLFDLTPDLAASEGHASHPDNGHIRVELKLTKSLPDPVTCLLYLECEYSILVDQQRNVSTDF